MSMNNGEISNKGVEIEIGTTLPVRRDIVWDGTLVFSWNRNRILALNQLPTNAYQLVYYGIGASNTWMEAYDMNTVWSYQYGGIENRGLACVFRQEAQNLLLHLGGVVGVDAPVQGDNELVICDCCVHALPPSAI
jgi:hypothetical protein